MTDAIIAALGKLDTGNDDHWTADGQPKLEALGIDGLRRKDVTETAPHFTRANPKIDTPAIEEKKAEEKKAPTLEEQLEDAKEAVEKAEKVFMTARKALDDTLVIRDRLEAEIARGRGSEPSNKAVMDYLAFQKKLREEKAGG